MKVRVRLPAGEAGNFVWPWHLGGIRKVCSASIFGGGDFSCEPALDDSRRNVLPLGDCLGVGDALSCPAGSGTSPWAHWNRHNKTRVSPMRTAGLGRSSVFAFSSFPFFSTSRLDGGEPWT